MERVTAAEDSPEYLSAAHGYIYWRRRPRADAGTPFEVVRLPHDVAPCVDACTPPEVIMSSNEEIRQIGPESKDLINANRPQGVDTVMYEAAKWGAPLANATIGKSDGVLNFSPLSSTTLWGGPSLPITPTTNRTLYRLERGLAKPVASWVGPPSIGSLAQSCNEVFIAGDPRQEPAIYHAVDGGLEPLPCPEAPCVNPKLTFTLAVDSEFVYVAQPDGNGLWRTPRVGGRAEQVVAGDIWDVITDDNYVYVTDINGFRLMRLPKHK